ncbi:MAG: hypothetical protein JRJ77_12105 [Deltaproteobacteria bacterium]|nr:hypothetical protein [Deltaproteobacteria bacterium]
MDKELEKQMEKFVKRYGPTLRQLATDLTAMVDERDGDSLFLSRHMLRIMEANITAVLGNDPNPVNQKGKLAELTKFVSFN